MERPRIVLLDDGGPARARVLPLLLEMGCVVEIAADLPAAVARLGRPPRLAALVVRLRARAALPSSLELAGAARIPIIVVRPRGAPACPREEVPPPRAPRPGG